jgi:WD40 repeat protein
VSRDRVLRIWQAERSTAYLTPHAHSVRCIASCHASGLLATGAYDGTLALFDCRARRFVASVRLSEFGISSLARGPRAGSFLASSYDGHVYLVGADARVQRLFAQPRLASAA